MNLLVAAKGQTPNLEVAAARVLKIKLLLLGYEILAVLNKYSAVLLCFFCRMQFWTCMVAALTLDPIFSLGHKVPAQVRPMPVLTPTFGVSSRPRGQQIDHSCRATGLESEYLF